MPSHHEDPEVEEEQLELVADMVELSAQGPSRREVWEKSFEEAQQLPSPLMQSTIVFTSSRAAPGASPAVELRVHVSLQCFADYYWVLITEDCCCMPGAILEVMAPELETPEPYGGLAMTRAHDLPPPVEMNVLLGPRDHPLTNIVATALGHEVHQWRAGKQLLLCVCLRHAADILHGSDEKRAFVREIVKGVKEAAGQA